MHNKARQIAIEYLTEWGEWEAEGRYTARAHRSQLDRFVKHGSGSGEGMGSIPAIHIPDRISRTGRAMAALSSLSPKYHRAVWLQYVRAYNIEGRDRIGDSRENRYRAEEMGLKPDSYSRILSAAIDVFVVLLKDA